VDALVFPTVIKSGRSAHVISMKVPVRSQGSYSHLLGDGETRDILLKKLKKISDEHKKLDEALTLMISEPTTNRINIQRIKKHKLFLKDTLTQLKNQLRPDIIA